MRKNEYEKHTLTPCAAQAFESWWPQKESSTGRDFGPRMRALQADLIRCHAPTMSEEDLSRAEKTLAWLDQ